MDKLIGKTVKGCSAKVQTNSSAAADAKLNALSGVVTDYNLVQGAGCLVTFTADNGSVWTLPLSVLTVIE